MKIVIDISKDRYDEIMAMDWKNCRRFFDEEIRAIHDGKALEQEPCEDCISRQDAVNACRNGWVYDDETIEHIVGNILGLPPVTPAEKQEPCDDEYIKVPKKALKYRTAGMVAYNAEWLKDHFDIERAVICGAQEPCDAVSRKEAIDACLKGLNRKEMVANIKALPPVTPAEKVGYWTKDVNDARELFDTVRYYCSACGDWQGHGHCKYCPNCGAKMEEGEE